ncbi:MAG: UMP kinase [Candidatus Heimdallarchaeaceae archaeon]
MKIVIKIGGSLLYSDGFELDTDLMHRYIDVINAVIDSGHDLTIVVGGGKLARMMIKASNLLGGNYAYQDALGVEASRMHALLFIASLGDKVYRVVPRSFQEVRKALSMEKMVICGGLQPGQSTNAVTSLLAELWEADMIINLSDVDKVYDKDPDKYQDAKAFDTLSIDEFYNIIVKQEERPGQYALFDRVGCEVIRRSKIKLVFTNGKSPENILKIINGERIGTIVQ